MHTTLYARITKQYEPFVRNVGSIGPEHFEIDKNVELIKTYMLKFSIAVVKIHINKI